MMSIKHEPMGVILEARPVSDEEPLPIAASHFVMTATDVNVILDFGFSTRVDNPRPIARVVVPWELLMAMGMQIHSLLEGSKRDRVAIAEKKLEQLRDL